MTSASSLASSAGRPPPLIACIDSSKDLTDFLALVLSEEGYRTASYTTALTEGAQVAIDYLTRLVPDVCVYAVSFPYAASWAEFQAVQAAPPRCAFVVTTTYKRALDDVVGPTPAIEILGKPFDLDQLSTAVRRALAGPLRRPD